MDLLSVIRRWHFRQGIPIREIRRRTGLSRNTIRKYLRDDAVEPTFKVPKRPSKLDQFAEKLTTWLRVESGKSRKQKRTAKQLHADLVKLGYEGSYSRVAAFARSWKTERQYEKQTSGRGTFVPLIFQPGEAFQFDWSEDYALLNGRPTKLQVAHTKLSHSRAFITRAYLLQTHEMLFDALTQAFRVLGGVPQRGIFDNMKTAVDRIGQGKVRQVNARFAAMASHYLFETDFCNPASGWEKGQVEKNVQDARRRLWQPMPNFPDLDALNAWLEERCIAQWGEIQHGVLPGTVADVHAVEIISLMPMGRAFDGFVEHTKRVSPTCLIAFERNRYRALLQTLMRLPRLGPWIGKVGCDGRFQRAAFYRRGHPMGGPLVLPVRHQLPRSRGNAGGTWHRCRSHDHLSLGAALCAGDGEAVALVLAARL